MVESNELTLLPLSTETLELISRLVIVNEHGRQMDMQNLRIYAASIQDEGQTLKLFVKERKN